jgi:hypothetical protein
MDTVSSGFVPDPTKENAVSTDMDHGVKHDAKRDISPANCSASWAERHPLIATHFGIEVAA